MTGPSDYPIGQTLSFQVGPMTIEHEIVSKTTLNARHVAGPMVGKAETMSVTITPIRPGLFSVTWQEADKSTVVHIEDFDAGTVRVVLTTADLAFVQFQGA